MPAVLPVPGVIRATTQGLLSGIPIANVFHLQYSGPPPSGNQLVSLTVPMAAAWNTYIAPITSIDLNMNLFTAVDLSSDLGSSAETTASHPGAITGPIVPNQVSMVISKSVARRYRGGHPRTYLAGMPAADLADGAHWTPTAATNAGNAWKNFIQALVGLVGYPSVIGECVVHYKRAGVALNPPLVDSLQGAVGNIEELALSGVYTLSPTSLRVPVGAETASAAPSTGYVWIVRWLSFVQTYAANAHLYVRDPQGQYIYDFWPAAATPSRGLDLRFRLNAGQALRFTAFVNTCDVSMTVYQFTS